MKTKSINSSELTGCWTAERYFDKCYECSRFDRCDNSIVSEERKEKLTQIEIKREKIRNLQKEIGELK